jgi:hypothetical protein
MAKPVLSLAFSFACLITASLSPARAADFDARTSGADSAPVPQIGTTPWIEQKVTASDGAAGDILGSSVAISGNSALIGAMWADVNGHDTQGAVYVFNKSGSTWTQGQKLVASDGAAGDHFGSSMALLGDTVFITAPLAAVNGQTWQGAVYVFTRTGGTWTQQQKLVAGHGQAFGTFGIAVAINANSAFIGAGGANQGGVVVPRSVYVFRFDPAARVHWSEKQTFDAPSSESSYGSFGASLAASTTTFLVGARATTVNGNIGQGVAYVYNDINGSWTQTDQLSANDGGARDNFGVSLAIEGTTALIGSPGAVINGHISQGAVYRFDSSSGTWLQQQKLVASDGTSTSLLGASVNLKGDLALFGAYAAGNYKGAAYLFNSLPSGWAQNQKLTASDGAAGDVFGYFTALDTGTALIGAYAAQVNGKTEQGAAYFYTDPCRHDTTPEICSQ